MSTLMDIAKIRLLLSLGVVGLLLGAPVAVLGQTPTSGTITIDPTRFAGTDTGGRLLIFAPNPVQSGSSISHFDSSAFPNLLMEPGISSDLTPLATDITGQALRDMGWSSGSSNFSINFTDDAGQGFNHPTLGNQRRTALRRATEVFERLVQSSVTINVDAKFQALSCSTTAGATLANASTNFVFTVAGSPFPQSWYHGALAEALTGQNLSLNSNSDPSAGELRMTFNSSIDDECLGTGRTFYYGTNEEAEGQLHFINVALHEIAHGLGFSTFINASTGQQFSGRPDIYSHFLRDTVFRREWADLSESQIRTSAVRSGRLIWTGSLANRQARGFLDPATVFLIEPPSAFAGVFEVGVAEFGAKAADTMPTAELVVARDGSASPTLLCGAVTNRAAVGGRIAVVDRGECNFTVKVKNAQNAGALGVIVVNNENGIINMGGDDPTLVIPAILVSPQDGATIRSAINNPRDAEDPDDPDQPGGGNNPPIPPLTTEGVDGPTEEPSTCAADDTTLCLVNNRYRAEMTFTTDDQLAQPAQAVPLTPDTGYFWFFAQTNVEVVLKVIDGCVVNQKSWVFAGGLTDVIVSIKVVDTQTGASRLYTSSGGDLLPVQDNNAFDNCPGN